jgi:hypothetical protein
MRVGLAVAAMALGALLSGAAPQARAAGSLVDEVKVGAFLHDVGGGNRSSDTADLNLEVNFAALPFYDGESGLLDYLLNPRPVLGLSLNADNDTNRIYAGFSWEYAFRSGFFINPGFGFALHDGNRETDTRACTAPAVCSLPGNRAYEGGNEPSLGTLWLFHESIEVGYRVAERHAFSLYASHISNAGIDNDNDGMNFVGLRYGLKFH